METMSPNLNPQAGTGAEKSKTEYEQSAADPARIDAADTGRQYPDESRPYSEVIRQRFEERQSGIENHLALIGEIRATISRLMQVMKNMKSPGDDS